MTQAQLVSGAGNLFVLFDAREGHAPSAEEARIWCECAAGKLGRAADGLLVLREELGATRLVVWNADGSLAAACGNGLRCAGWFLLHETGRKEVTLETEKGPRRVCGATQDGGAEALTADLGVVRVTPLGDELPLLVTEQEAWRGDVGNPHCVFLVEDVYAPGFEERGATLQAHPLFPGGVNVGYLAQQEGRWKLRVFERGVGETAAGGTGAAAAAHVLHAALGVPLPVELELFGGRLRITLEASGGASVTGPVECLGPLSLKGSPRSLA